MFAEYPCKQIKYLEKSYRTRYGASLMDNSQSVKEKGLEAFMEQQKANYTCPECGGIISIHDMECSECQRKVHKAIQRSGWNGRRVGERSDG